MHGSGQFFKGLSELLNTLLEATSRLSKAVDQRRRRDAICDLLASCLIAQEIVQNGQAILNVVGPDPVRKITEMPESQWSGFGSECLRLLGSQVDRLIALSELLHDAPVLGILDSTLKRDLDTLIGDKNEGLMAIAAPLGFYLHMGAFPEEADITRYGEKLACLRYQSSLFELLFSGSASGAQPTIDLDSARANLDGLNAAAERLRTRVLGLASQEEIVVLANRAKERANRHKNSTKKL